MARTGGYQRLAVWRPCGVTLHAALQNKSIVCSRSWVINSTVMKLHEPDNRGGIAVKTYTKSTCSHMFVSSYSTCQFITAATGPFQVCLLNESVNVITYFLLCTYTEKSHMRGDNIYSLPSDTDSVDLKDNEFSNSIKYACTFRVKYWVLFTFDFLWFVSSSQLFQEGVVKLLGQVRAHRFVEIWLVAFECHAECELLLNIIKSMSVQDLVTAQGIGLVRCKVLPWHGQYTLLTGYWLY